MMSSPAALFNPARDNRLDLARGVMLIMIFIAHTPNNPWAGWIPARFGFSSGAEIFVFVSGIASGIAFGRVFTRQGFLAGSKRIARRILQLYGAHLGTLLALGGLALLVDGWMGSDTLSERYGLTWLRDKPADALARYATLRYVPPFFDILPMYMILLALIIPAMALGRYSFFGVITLSAGLWLLMQLAPLDLPGDPVSGAPWFFNPFAWQFLFLIGYAFGIGWLKAPSRRSPVLLAVCLLYLVLSVPLTFGGIQDRAPDLAALNRLIYPADAITRLHPLRLFHFLALAYVFYSIVDPAADWLRSPRLDPLYAVGRNSFACFLIGLGLSMTGGIAFDLFGNSWGVSNLVNMVGVGLMLAAGTILHQSSSVTPAAVGKR